MLLITFSPLLAKNTHCACAALTEKSVKTNANSDIRFACLITTPPYIPLQKK